MDEYPLQRWILFLTFVESLEMIFSQYTETCEILLYYPRIGGEDIKYFSKKCDRNILHASIDVHSRRLISEFPAHRIKCIEKLQSYCANMTLADKSRYDSIFHKVTHKGGGSAMNYSKIFQNSETLSVSVGNSYSEDQLMLIFLGNFHKGGKYSAHIASQQAQLRREGTFTDQNLYLSHPYTLII